GVGVGHANIFPGEDGHAAKDEAGVFACVHHFGHPVERGIGVRAANAFNEGGDGVVMHVPFFVVEDGAPLDRFFGNGEGDVDTAVGVGGGGFDGQFEGVEYAAGVAVGHIHEMIEGIGV